VECAKERRGFSDSRQQVVVSVVSTFSVSAIKVRMELARAKFESRFPRVAPRFARKRETLAGSAQGGIAVEPASMPKTKHRLGTKGEEGPTGRS